MRAYVGLGSNLGDAEGTLAAAVSALAALPGVRLRAVSRLYVTAPVGVVDQPAFRNAVAALEIATGQDATTAAIGLLVALKAIERALGRRERRRWGPREVDLDLLVFGRHEIDVERPPGARSLDPAKTALSLIVPHPEAQHRLFVLAPLADLVPGLVPPGWGETVATAAARQRRLEGEDAVHPTGAWVDGAWRSSARGVDGKPGFRPGPDDGPVA